MRLLDLIAQGRSARVQTDVGLELPGAHRFSDAIRQCPLRYVLSDELARCATQLAFAEGDRLSGCLDLIHVPGRSLWVEWPDAPRREAIKAIPALELNHEGSTSIRHSGALITAAADCRSGQLRTFWSSLDEQAYLSPLIITFDLDRSLPALTTAGAAWWRGDTALQMPGEPAIEELCEHLHFHLDDEWAADYRARCRTEEGRTALLRRSLGGCAFDAPMLMAFFLLLGARDLLPRQQISRERINRVRRQGGKPPLLEHIEVAAPIDNAPAHALTSNGDPIRSSPRLHHVRGHIVRRGTAVFWRSPHMRGSGRLGQVRSRTVVLALDREMRSKHSQHAGLAGAGLMQ